MWSQNGHGVLKEKEPYFSRLIIRAPTCLCVNDKISHSLEVRLCRNIYDLYLNINNSSTDHEDVHQKLIKYCMRLV